MGMATHHRGGGSLPGKNEPHGRLNYDVLNHTDLSRDGGASGDIDLALVDS